MRTIEITGSTGKSKILIGESLDNLPEYLPAGRAVIVTDSTVDGLYRDRFPSFPIVVIGTGEPIKRLETVTDIYQAFIDLEVDRDTFIIGIGGGIICDITGFTASTFMRGLSYGFVATTLLAQVDASVGGKNGVNFGGNKNMVGVFNQPDFVLCDPSILKTLSRAEISNGLAEAVKHTLIADAEAFTYLEAHAEDILALDPEAIEKVIYDAIFIKAGIVGLDELEQGERRKLNFGHTLGHAVESASGLPHGQAVSVGMAVAVQQSVARGYLRSADADRILALLKKLELPTGTVSTPQDLIDAVRQDKKKSGERIYFILLIAIGEAIVEAFPLAEIEKICQTSQNLK